MTVEAHGHVQSLALDGGSGDIAVTIALEQTRSRQLITIFAKPDEITMYRPGMAAIVQVRPAPKTGEQQR
jgi:hypothetical protein